MAEIKDWTLHKTRVEHNDVLGDFGFDDAKKIIEKNAWNDKQWWNEWLRNADYNFTEGIAKYEIKSIKELFNKAKGENVIVVGAGRSITHDKYNQAKLRMLHKIGVPIIAVDRVFNLLQSLDIMPDIVVNVDAQAIVTKFFDFNGQRLPSAVISLLASPELFEHIKDNTDNIYGYLPQNPFSLAMQFIYNEYGKEYAGLKAGSVVFYSAVDLAIMMGFKYICGLGNDMIYLNPDDVNETRQTAQLQIYHISNSELYVFTNQSFISALNHLKLLPVIYKDVRFINCSHAEGLFIDGWIHCSFKDLDFEEEKIFNDTIKNLCSGGGKDGGNSEFKSVEYAL